VRTLLIFIALICASAIADAQINYLLNPSFEQYVHCPNNYDEIKLAYYWSSIGDTILTSTDTLGTPFCTPEYCNTCGTNFTSSVPTNGRFNHYPRTGNGLAQVTMYVNVSDDDLTSPYKRDYLQGRLKQPLQSGTQYCVTFYACLENASGFAIDHLGAYFDNGNIDTTTNCGWPQTMCSPQIAETSIISDEVNWTKIQGTIIGSGDEKFITIGNFFDAAHTDTMSVPSTFSGSYITWYLIDDISVIEIDSTADAGPDVTIPMGDSAWIGTQDDYLPCKWYYASTGALIDSNHAGLWVHPTVTTSYVMELDVCGTLSYDTVTVTVASTRAQQIAAFKNLSVYPNPAVDNFTVSGLIHATSYKLMNAVGTCMQQGEVSNGGSIAVSNLPAGVYVLELNDKEGSKANFKVIKQ